MAVALSPKSPAERLDYSWSPELDAGDTITGTPATLVLAGGVTIAGLAVEAAGTRVRFFVEGGTANTTALVRVTVNTTGGRILQEVLSIEIYEPSANRITLGLAKQHLEYDADDRDDLIQSYIHAAANHIEDVTGLALTRLSRAIELDGFPEKNTPVRLGVGPDVDVTAVAYVDDEGATQTLTGWTSFGQIIRPETVWPANARTVTVTATYGYDSVPEAIVQAQLLLIGHMFANREASADRATVEALLHNKRVWAF